MTPKRLSELVVKGARGKLCDELAPLDEKQREALAETALRLYRHVDQIWAPVCFEEMKEKDVTDPEAVDLVKAISAQKHKDWRVPRWTGGLALLGLCDKKVVKGNGPGSWFGSDILAMPERVLQILDQRRPSWLAAWIKEQSRSSNPDHSIWAVERGLIRSGALPPNQSDDYIQRMVFGVHSRFGPDDAVKTDNLKGLPKTLKDALLADPALLKNEVWRLFEVETLAFQYESDVWMPSLVELSKGGKLDRQRLLKASVQAMALPFRQGVLSGYAKLHEALKPTPEERNTLLTDYLALLGCQTPLVTGNALDALEILAKGKRLKALDFLEASPPVFHLAKKGQPIKAIKIIKLFIKDDPSCAAAAAKVVVSALNHESADVQETAIGLLESLRENFSSTISDEIQSRSDQVAASLQSRLDALTRVQQGKPTAKKSSPTAYGAKSDLPEDLQLRATKIRSDLRTAAGVDAALACIAEQTEPLPILINPRRVPRRGSATAVVPLASLDELIEAVTAFIERIDDVMEIERILDGISRFYLERPADFDNRVAALRKRIEARSEPYSGTVLDRAADLGISQVIRHWLAMPPIQREFGAWSHLGGVQFRKRTQSLINWGMERKEYGVPLLALPTQSDGWLDPVSLVQRLRIQDKAKVYVVDSIDLAQAFLRLTPDGRTDALKEMAGIKLHGMDIVRFALGEGRTLPIVRGRGGHELTLAAVHARALIDNVTDLDLAGVVVPAYGLRDDGSIQLSGPMCDDLSLPGNMLPCAFSWEVAMPDMRPLGITGDGSWGHAGRDESLLVGWETLVWPANRRANCLLASLSCNSSPTFLNNLLNRDMTWHDEATRLAAWALGSDVPTAKGLVTDALIEALGECTLDPTLLGKHLAAILDRLKLNRVAAVLAEVARVSPLHCWNVFKIIDTLLGRLKQVPADLHYLLSVLLETATLTGQLLSENACARLKSIPGTSKTSKLAKQLLGLEADPAKMSLVRAAALSASVARAERWASLGFA